MFFILFYIYNFYFENLIYKWVDKIIWKLTGKWFYFFDNILVRVKVAFLPDSFKLKINK